jgi:predicted CXXCH cytochrome family protein
MRRAIWVVGVAVASGVLSAGFGTRESSAQGEAKYIGPVLCSACHKNTHPDVFASSEETAHANAMWSVEDANATRKVVADFAAGAPFSRDDVAYVLGLGREYQAFLDSDLKLLPGEWSVEESKWVDREAVDASRDWLGGHTTGFDPETKKWVALGVTCEACHGPGSLHTGSQDKMGTTVRPQELEPARRAMICGQCHAQGSSKDGSLRFPAGYRPGGDLGECFVLEQQVPDGARNSQYNELVQGGGDHVGAGVVCTACHNPHGQGAEGAPAQLRSPTNQLCLQEGCHAGTLPEKQHPEAILEKMSCSACHMPKGKHAFVSPGK